MDPVVVVGAGISGVAAARALTDGGRDVVVLDRGRRVGGRMASRRTDGRMVDTGASYFTVSDDSFRAQVARWEGRHLARPWTDTFSVAHDGDLSPKSGPVRWAAPGGLRSLVEDLATGLDVRETAVERVGPGPSVDGLAASAVVLAMPDPQAVRLLDPAYATVIGALTDPFDPVLALTATFPGRSWPDVDGAFVSGDPVLSWVADDGRRRGDGAPVLVAHSTPEFAAEHLAAPEEAAGPMTAALRDALGIEAEPTSTHVHRWTFGKPSGTRDRSYFLDDQLVGVCGDAWSDKPRVESAYLSGRALGEALLQRLA
ncbi:MAG: NAD(P)/FAD-dependent oxidoreductase [Janthinobacterium lividum]